MVRPIGPPLAKKAVTLEDLRQDFLAHCEARNLSARTLEWYADRTQRFVDWCTAQGLMVPSDLRWTDLEQFVLDRRRQGFAPSAAALPRSGEGSSSSRRAVTSCRTSGRTFANGFAGSRADPRTSRLDSRRTAGQPSRRVLAGRDIQREPSERTGLRFASSQLGRR